MSGQPIPSATARSVSSASSASSSCRWMRARLIRSSTFGGASRPIRSAGPDGAAGALTR
jgi:hypothetical protein